MGGESLTSSEFLLLIDLGTNFTVLSRDIGVFGIEVADLDEVGESLVALVVVDQPTRTLRSEKDHDDEKSSWNKLD